VRGIFSYNNCGFSLFQHLPFNFKTKQFFLRIFSLHTTQTLIISKIKNGVMIGGWCAFTRKKYAKKFKTRKNNIG